MTEWTALASITAVGPMDEGSAVERLSADLLASHSATLTLERWCAVLGLAAPATVYAEVDQSAPMPPVSEALCRRLAVSGAAELAYRRVRLKCGAHILSEASNWYVPARLTADMNAALVDSDVPFGRVILPLSPVRHNLSVEISGRGGAALRHRALVTDGEGRPLAEVVEDYQAVLVDRSTD